MMSVRTMNPTSSHTLTLVLHHIRVPFQPKDDPGRKLADEIESCKRKIWECVDPSERQRYLEKKQRKDQLGKQVVVNKENSLPHIAAKVETANGNNQENLKSHMKVASSNRSNIEFQVNAMKVTDLKKELKLLGIDAGGLKKDLRSRLLQAMLDTVEAPLERPVSTSQRVEVESSCSVAKPSTGAAFSLGVKADDNPYDQNPKVNVVSSVGKAHSSFASDVILKKNQKDSFSSMQVEHHLAEISGTILEAPRNHEADSDDAWLEQTRPQSKESKSPNLKVDSDSCIAPTKVASNQNSSSKGRQARVSDEEMTPADRFEQTDKFPLNVEKATADVPDISPPASEASSASSKSSGKMVKDMVSKFSGFTSLSSTSSSSSSALSKGLQAKKEARLAKMAEIREKSKPVTSTKTALVSKEYASTLSSLSTTANSASSKKNTLAAQMREKAAAAAMSLKKDKASTTSTTSKPILASAGKRHLPLKINSQQIDQLGATMKQQPSISKKPSDVQSPIDTYEISDREDSGTDDSGSESDNDKQKKKIPTWALRANLLPALEQQYNGCIGGRKVDPDTLFPEVQSCDLEAIFENKKAKYRSRTSSGNWTRDKVTAAEKLVYKRDMGFATDFEVSEI